VTAKEIEDLLRKLGSPERARHSARYFKTGPGEYAEGDLFIGAAVPAVRRLVSKHRDLDPSETLLLVRSPIHEARLAGLLIWTSLAERGDAKTKQDIYKIYLQNTVYINNWDLVDVSCRPIVGGWLADKPRDPIVRLARSKILWERRIAIVSTQYFMRCGELQDAFSTARLLMRDKSDLIHKAVGWTLREAGKKNHAALEEFLSLYAHDMPRTALRYALERTDPEKRTMFMKMKSDLEKNK
jgi:3-methyladenine DNA glycosylase AlkD